MSPWLQLLKLRITAASTVTTVVGYVLARGRFDWPLVPVAAGILLQACGAAAFNQVQDSRVDALMARTAGRPIPSGAHLAARGGAIRGGAAGGRHGAAVVDLAGGRAAGRSCGCRL
ncbi:MAG: UbiA family prenyltransferase [bacterium]|nr:UbiA family prenyltransferase [bacterium]